MSLAAKKSQHVDERWLNAFVGRMLGDMSATLNAALILVGDRLGLYKALVQSGPIDSAGLAKRTGLSERYVREWLSAQAAAGYVGYDTIAKRYRLAPEQAMVFADETSPVFLVGFFEIAAAAFRDEPKITEAFKSGRGVGWHEHHRCLFHGTERFFRTSYRHYLVAEWLPALAGVVVKLERGAIVADVGCGHGASTILMAEAFPNSRFHGFDYHAPSIEAARDAAESAGVAGSAGFEVASAKDYPVRGYDLICFFDCLHDMGDPVGAAAYAKRSPGAVPA